MPDSLVFIPFEFLGSGSNPDWIGRATAAIAARQTSSLASPAVRDAQNNRQPHVVEGYVSGQEGALRVVATVRDQASQKTVRSFEAQGKNVLELAHALAGQIVAKPNPYTSSNPDAIREFFTGNPSVALAKDPKFGSAYVAHIEELNRSGKRDEARAAITAARGANLTELEQAQLQALAAENPKDRAGALMRAAEVSRYDLSLWRAAGDAALVAKDHAGAVKAYKQASALDPSNIAVWNTMAYAQAFAGDLEGAKRSLGEYKKLQPRDPNAFDSLGEIHFYSGKFVEAEQEFLRAFEMDNSRLGGGEAYRAALAAFLAGDRIKAESHFGRYIAFRRKVQDQLVPLRESVWLYTTGRKAEARKKAAESNLPAAKAQLTVWDAMESGTGAVFGERPDLAGWKAIASGRYAEAVEYWKKLYDASSLIEGNEARIMLAVALHGAQRQAEANAILAKWPLPPTGADPGFGSVAFAKAIELKAGLR